MSQSVAVEPKIETATTQAYPDWLGVGASVLCAIHCAAMPFVVGFLPLLGLSFLADPSFHKWMVLVCLVLALLAFVPGWRRHHRLAPTLIGLGGLGLISFAAFAGPEDCCPTPCGTTAPGEAALMSVAGPGGDFDSVADAAPCTAACCPSESPATTVAMDEEVVCAAACCESAPEPTPAIVTVAEEASCDAGCCPEEDDSVVLAGTGGFLDSDFMALVWLWMTPIGGVILVVAHLTNHRLSGPCKAGCCPTDPDPQAKA